MLILVTNDDGYDAPGLWVAYDLAHKLGGKNAQVAVIAPKTEQSGVGHAMSYVSPIRADKVREGHFVVHGFPTDCIILSQELLGQKPDLVISGVNMGHNLGPDALYSGTIGAAIEATAQGIPAIALSQYYKKSDEADFDAFDSARTHGLKTLNPIWKKFELNWPKGRLCNINFPPCKGDDVQGIKLCRSEPLRASNIVPFRRETPMGRDYFWLGHSGPIQAHDKDYDVALSQQKWVTASFMNLDLCDLELCDQNQNLFDQK